MEDKSSEITLTISKDLGFFKIENGENNNKTSWHKTNSTNYTSEGYLVLK